MTCANPVAEQSVMVVGSSISGVSRWVMRLIACLLGCVVALWITTPWACATDTSSNQAPVNGPTITDTVTDPENLLGANAAEVTDAIADTEHRTGVHVRLLYLESFNAGKGVSPEQWASHILESTKPKPKPNTVLLAVASGDGNLVVAVSANSDAWLRNPDTVDALSEAAREPLISRGNQHWAQSALAMMKQLDQEKQTATAPGLPQAGVIAMGAVFVALVIAVGVATVLRRRHAGHGRHRAA